jgi:hypothetical protein
MIEQPTGAIGFRQSIRELLKSEPVMLVPMTERNLPKFENVLTDLSATADMLPMTGNVDESVREWVENTKGVWIFGAKDVGDLTEAGAAQGFVNVYEPEHLDTVNAWQAEKGKRVYEKGQVLELASFGQDTNEGKVLEDSAVKLTLDKVFNGMGFKDVRAVTVWVDHDANNVMDADTAARTVALGGKKLGVARYNPSESVDSTCFVIPRQAFIDTLTGGHK